MDDRKAAPKSEELVDPWALPTPPPAAAAALRQSPPAGGLPEAITADGKVNMSCFVPISVGAVTGSIGGALMNIFAKQSAVVGGLAGAATMATVSSVTCGLIKSRDGSIYDKSNDRAIAYAAGGAVWPMAGEVARTILRQPLLHPKVAMHRALTGLVAGGLFGFALDYFDIGRPEKPADLAPPANPKQ